MNLRPPPQRFAASNPRQHRGTSRRPPRPSPRPGVGAYAAACAALLVVALICGGGTIHWLLSDAVVELAALPLLVWAVWRLPQVRVPRTVLVLFACVALFPLWQLVPLPPAFWVHLPGRAAIADGFSAIDAPLPWLPVSLSPSETWRAWFCLFPAAAMFVAVLSVSGGDMRRLRGLVLGIAVVSVVLDVLQMMGGGDSPLRFYTPTNEGNAVGLFANRNHNAAFLYTAIALSIPWALEPAIGATRALKTLALVVFYFCTLVGLGLAGSRAGLLLGGLAALPLLVIGARRGWQRAGRRMVWLGGGAIALLLLVAFVTFGGIDIAQRLAGTDLAGDLRWQIGATTLRALTANLPVGTGFGTFEPVYQIYERVGTLDWAFVNHAHDDWLELVVEAGLPCALLVAGFLIWYGRRLWTLWATPSIDVATRAASAFAVLLLMLHSLVDYPLRTEAMMVLFALCCATLARPLPAGGGINDRAH